MHLDLTIRDADCGQPLPCRLAFRGQGVPAMWGRDAIGQDMAYRGLPRLWCDGHWHGEMPDAPLSVVVSRPYEYETRTLELAPGGDHRQCIEVLLPRTCNLAAEGWHCGDAHQHVVHGEAILKVNLPMAAAVSRAEGVDWMVFDSGFTSVPGEEPPSPQELDRQCAAASSHDFVALWAQEYPKHDLGHLAAFPQDTGRSFADLAGEGVYRIGEGDRTPFTTFESVRVLQRHGSLAIYSHPSRELGGTPGRVGNIARELPLDILAAPWAIEAVDLITDRVDDPICWDMWYMWLNQGHRIALCALNDACFDRAGDGWKEPVAYRQTYVKIDGPLAAASLVDGIRAGRTMGTTGPLLLVDVDGRDPGHVFAADGAARTLHIRAWGGPGYDDPAQVGRIRHVAVIRNGQTHRVWELSGCGQNHVELNLEIEESAPAWYVVRIDGTLPQQLAVTSPVYFAAENGRPPQPYIGQVQASIVDDESGRPLSGCMELVEFSSDRVDVVETRSFGDGSFGGGLPADLRLRARVDGYQEQVLSPILDNERIYRDLLGGIRAADLADPAYYQHLRHALDHVRLAFRLVRKR